MQPFVFPDQTGYRVVQITDCHLLADAQAQYQGVTPAAHLAAIIARLQLAPPDAVIFTGDLSQEHSSAEKTLDSYHLLASLCQPLNCPVFLVPGNHDDIAALATLCQNAPFSAATHLYLGDWQLLLINTKSATPAGEIGVSQLAELAQALTVGQATHSWLFCHHHPWPLHCFIDRHGLQDADRFYDWLAGQPAVRGIAHGHAHMAYQQRHVLASKQITVVGCPASSVQFLPTPDWQTRNLGPQWCEWYFLSAGQVRWQFKRL